MTLRPQLQMLARLARSQAINVRNAARGWPLTYQGATAMTLDDDDLALAARLLEDRAGWSEAAPVEAFEREFAQWNASRSAFAFVSGRVALRAAIDALGLVPDDEVVVPGYTCVVVTNALRAAGLRPVFADIELDTYGLDRDALRRALTGRTKAVLIQHLYGYVTRDLDDLLTISRAHGLAVIEDCAQAAGAEHRGCKVGNFGDVAIFSGDPSKPFTCIQGGVAVAGDERIAARLAEIRRAAPLQSNDDVANRLRNVPLNYTLSKDRQRWWKGDLAWLRHGDDYFFGIPASEVAGAPPADLAIVLRYPVIVTPEMKRDLRWAYRALGVVPGTWFVTHLHPAPGRLDGVPNATCAVDRCINFPTLYFEDRWGATRRAG
ncbi:MAG: DegT/DnrJ/EryC1/StrS family aminotransferase [Acidobacteria bacterium]|nr:DegT/DnrJ/EryC1/StrS family aminotransferase [Acidobacteriota bacterium]